MRIKKYAEYQEQPLQVTATWKAALYIRLSREDGDKAESYSVTSQRAILKEYLKLCPDIEPYDFYIDDGWSGTNFNRPDFNRMMQDIYDGKVNCVIVKDLSRFGRNYTDAGNYLDNIFVRNRVRFIAINNGVDSASNNMNAATRCISVGVTNVINESVAATTSVNVRGTFNVSRAEGKFIGSFATYGYMKDPEDHNKLIVDEEAASVVRLIFEKYVSGESIIGITKDLNEMGIPNPSMYKRIKGYKYRHPAGKINDGLWPDSSVRRVLKNEMYIGNMVQGKNTTISYKINQCVAVPKDEWIIVEGTHEAIIDKETFEKAQALFNRNTRKPLQKRELELFSGLVRCADCHRIMNKKTNKHSYGEYRYYRCVTARKMKKGGCTNHTIRIDKLEEAVLVFLQKMVEVAAEYDTILERINSNNRRKKKSEHLEKTLETQIREREKCSQMLTELYPDWKNGIITQEEYISIKASIYDKINNLDSSIKSLKKATEEYENGVDSGNQFIADFKKFGTINKLTRPILTELIEEILVHEGGNITINLKCSDAFARATEYIEMNKDIAQGAKTA